MKKSPLKAAPRSKEEIAREMKLKADRQLIKEEFFPALKEATISIDEASQLLSATVAVIMEEAMAVLKEKTIKQIKGKLVKKLCPDDERLLQIEKLISIFDGKTLFDARGHFEAMKAVISQMMNDEMRNRKLDSLKEDWGRYLN